jgi:glycosyltransferase involved in cell wall biosynthesis
VVTEAHATRRQLIECGLDAGQIEIVRPGVDSQMFWPDASAKTAAPEILSVGRLKAYKGVDIALRAFKQVREAIPSAHLTVTGRGSEEERLVRLANRLGVEDSVTFTGFVEPRELASLYRKAWVHVQPSVVEGWGYTVIEAAACGTPTVAFRRGALPESVGPVSERYLTSDRNEYALARSLLSSLGDLASNPSLHSDALAEYSRQFDWDQTTTAYERLLFTAARIGYSEPSAYSVPVPASGWTRSR